MTTPRQSKVALAINGGSRVRTAPWRDRSESWHIGREEKAAVDALLDQAIVDGVSPGYGGHEEDAFCRVYATWLGGGYVDAVSSGTAALYVALRALNIEPFSEVIVSAITDPGGMMPIPLLNLIPVVADTAPGSYNAGPDQIESEITPQTRAIVVAHIGGEPANVSAIADLARRRGLFLIEDCAQAHGAFLHGRPVGTFGDLAVFSTMYGKHLTTGAQGGLVFARDRALYQAVRRASDRGKPFFRPPGATNALATLNLNLGDMACAIGRAQLRKLRRVLDDGEAVVSRLREGLASLPAVSVPDPIPGARPHYWFLRLRLHAEALTCDKSTFCAALNAEGLPITARYDGALPHTMEWFEQRQVFGQSGLPWMSQDYDGDRGRVFACPNAHEALDTHFNLHCHEHWGDQEIADAVAILGKVGDAYACDQQLTVPADKAYLT